MKEWYACKTHYLNKPNAYYLRVMSRYEKMIKSQPWYVSNQDKLESFSMVCTLMPEDRIKGIKKFWQGN